MSDTHALSELPSAASHATHIGQATSVEQSRAAAEVQALVIVAQNRPRVTALAVQEMEITCRQKSFADRAFYDYYRGGKRIYDINVDTARELARCWGNVQYAVTELSQDRVRHESELMAWAWDMQANVRVERKIIVPHIRNSTEGGDVLLTDVRDVYELLANNISRRVRECIKDILPLWFVEAAKAKLWETLKDGGGEPLPKRIAASVKTFADTYGVRLDQLERKLEAKSNEWTELDLAKLKVSFNNLRQGGRLVDEFPPVRIDSDDLERMTVGAAPVMQTPEQTPEQPAPQPGPQQTTAGYTDNSYHTGPEAEPGHAQERHALLLDHLATLGYNLTGEEVAEHMGELLGFTHASLDDLTPDEVETLLGELAPAMAANDPSSYLDRRLEQVRIATKRRTPMATRGHIATIHDRLRKLDYPTGGKGTAEKVADIATLIGRPISNTADLSAHEANDVITQLNMILEDEQPHQALRAALDARRRQQTSDWPDVVQPGTHTPESETHE
jgi:hypothetical protein